MGSGVEVRSIGLDIVSVGLSEFLLYLYWGLPIYRMDNLLKLNNFNSFRSVQGVIRVVRGVSMFTASWD